MMREYIRHVNFFKEMLVKYVSNPVIKSSSWIIRIKDKKNIPTRNYIGIQPLNMQIIEQ